MINVTITNCTLEEMPLITRMASLDGRNTGLNDPELFYRTDPDGFFIAVTDGNILGSISANRIASS
ncbi:MAG: GNAT family N-acetyltransferase, partial [Bacteroidetes bacterium]|nr:GNAT family N-acetyltransferase [Bacteroidota bacterium]